MRPPTDFDQIHDGLLRLILRIAIPPILIFGAFTVLLVLGVNEIVAFLVVFAFAVWRYPKMTIAITITTIVAIVVVLIDILAASNPCFQYLKGLVAR